MTNEREIERILDTWFADGPSEVPERVFDAVVDRIERQSQRPAWRVLDGERRLRPMVPPLLAVAAVIVVAVVGINLLPVISSGIVGSTPTSSPSPSPRPTPTLRPSPVAASTTPATNSLTRELWDALDAGTYVHDLTAPKVTFTIPAGWWLTTDFEVGFGIRPEAFQTDEGLRVWFDTRLTVNDAACTEAADPALGHTVDDMVAELTTREGVVASAPQPIAIGGLDGQWFDVRLSPDWTATCPFDPSQPGVTLFTDADPDNGDNTPFWGVSGDDRLRFYILDDTAGSTVLVVINTTDAATFETLLSEAQPVVDSLEFEVDP